MGKYILLNLKKFFRKEQGIFILCIGCIFLSCIAMLSAYGLFGIYIVKKSAEEQNLSDIEFRFTEDVTRGEFQQAILKLPQELNDKIISYYVDINISEEYPEWNQSRVDFHFTVKNGEIVPSQFFVDNGIKVGNLLHYFTEEQEKNGELVALVTSYPEEQKKLDIQDNKVIFLGKEYQIIATQEWSYVMVPFLSLDEDTILYKSSPSITLAEPITKKDYDLFHNTMVEELDGKVAFPDYEIPDLNILYRYNTILLVNLFIIGAAALNFSLLYRYMLIKRRGELAIFRTCGLRKGKAALLYLGECIGLVLPGTVAAFGCFHWLILPLLAKVHGDIVTLYSPVIYGKLIAGYLAVTFVILAVVIGMELRSSSMTLWLRGKRYE